MLGGSATAGVAIIAEISIGVRQAHATLIGAADFLGSARAPQGFDGRYRSKVIGNCLRELDRFLSVLIDEVAATIGIEDGERAYLRGRTNTANKLGRVSARGTSGPDHARLRALGRTRDCLFLADGLVRRGDDRHATTMTAGWPPRDAAEDAGMLRMALGSRLNVCATDLDRVCRFYGRLADDLLTLAGTAGRPRAIAGGSAPSS